MAAAAANSLIDGARAAQKGWAARPLEERIALVKAGIARLDGGPKGATLTFHNDKFANPAGLVEFVQNQRGLAKVRDNKIVVRRDWAKDSDKIKGAFAIARDLAEKVIEAKKA